MKVSKNIQTSKQEMKMLTEFEPQMIALHPDWSLLMLNKLFLLMEEVQ
jgi:hypothetical protein